MRAQFVKEAQEFQRGRDPKSTMGIGDISKRDFSDSMEVAKWILRNIEKVTNEEIKRPCLKISIDRRRIFGSSSRLQLIRWIRNNLSINNEKFSILERR